MNSVEYFDSIANEWNNIRTGYFEEKLKGQVINTADAENKVCADLGCGAGFISLELCKIAKTVFSLDSSRNMLLELNQNAKLQKYNNLFPIHGSMERIPLFDDSIDVIFTNMALHHVMSPKRAISEMYRILKKGGSVIISDVLKHSGEWAKTEMHDVWLGFSIDEIFMWLNEAGFKNISVTQTGLKCKGVSSKGEYTETGIFIAKGMKEE